MITTYYDENHNIIILRQPYLRRQPEYNICTRQYLIQEHARSKYKYIGRHNDANRNT
jgi:hypothetical protein